jgi:hypothetical protein
MPWCGYTGCACDVSEECVPDLDDSPSDLVSTLRSDKRTLTYGTLPERDEFDAAFDARAELHPARKLASVGAVFRFSNDPRVGTCALNNNELWAELVRAQEEWAEVSGDSDTDDEFTARAQVEADFQRCEKAGQWCSDVLSILGFEWV